MPLAATISPARVPDPYAASLTLRSAANRLAGQSPALCACCCWGLARRTVVSLSAIVMLIISLRLALTLSSLHALLGLATRAAATALTVVLSWAPPRSTPPSAAQAILRDLLSLKREQLICLFMGKPDLSRH